MIESYVYAQREVAAIEKFVRKKMLAYLNKTGMSKYEFSRRSGIPKSTIRSIEQKEDYDIRESNILKICKGMGIEPCEIFMDNSRPIMAIRDNEINLLHEYRKLTEKDQGRIEGYLRALVESIEVKNTH